MNRRIQRFSPYFVSGIALTIVILALVRPTNGEEPSGVSSDEDRFRGFRVLSQVTDTTNGTVLHTNVSLIGPSRTFDWSCDNLDESVLIDFLQERVVLVNTSLQRCAYVTFAQLLEFQNDIAGRSEGTPVLKFAANPGFTNKNWNVTTKTVSLQHALWNYEACLTLDSDPEFVRQYHVSADWLARLNTTRPGLPAGPRLELNREIASHQGLPVRVDLRREIKPGQSQILRSTHEYTWELTKEDYARIVEIERAIGASKPWSLLEHQRNRANNDAHAVKRN